MHARTCVTAHRLPRAHPQIDTMRQQLVAMEAESVKVQTTVTEAQTKLAQLKIDIAAKKREINAAVAAAAAAAKPPAAAPATDWVQQAKDLGLTGAELGAYVASMQLAQPASAAGAKRARGS